MASENKTEKATPRRRQKVREEGNVPKSPEVAAVSVMLGGFLLMLFFLPFFLYNFLLGSFRELVLFISPDRLSGNDILLFWDYNLKRVLLWIFLIFGAVFGIAVISQIAQFGFIFTLKPLKPKLEKLNPIKGLKNIFFSLNSLFELAKNLVKIAVIVAVAYYFVTNHTVEILSLYKLPLEESLKTLGELLASLTAYIIAVGIAIAGVDFAYRKWKWEKDIMMTKEEVKEEYKQTEGNPEVKREIRKRMRQIIAQRMLQEVPKATVVITNPTHFAVALKYDLKKDNAPKVVAKGVDHMAKRIIEIAKKNNVEIYRDPPLARALYYSVEVGQEIPEKFYKAVAKIIAYVYRKTAKV